ncbi:MAG TPA: phosphate ABC transporter ATP-binding protein [Anaerolineae bacterium]|nr:phosphate ABC transporter ATP-binding protein [Anaerolineae bacterium]
MNNAKIHIRNLTLHYSDGLESLNGINLDIQPNAITVIFGPAGGGKSTLLRAINRLIDMADVEEVSGEILFHGKNILDLDTDVTQLRHKIGIVFSRPIPLPLSIFGNVAFGLEVTGEHDHKILQAKVEEALRQAYLWDEVHDRLDEPAASLSGGQQQRLCLARVLTLKPEVIMLDEPTSALDPVTTAKIESFLHEVKSQYTIILVPHNVSQSARMADYAAFFLQGKMIEYGKGKTLFINPKDKRTQDYVTGRFG